MVHRGADARLLSNLISQEKEYSKQWATLLHSSSSSLAGFTAYAAASEPTTSRAILNVAGVLSAADDALAGYRRSLDEWRDLLKGLQQLEEEVGNIVRDREILVTRLIKASNKSSSSTTSNIRRFSASSSSVNLQSRSIPTSTKLAAAQTELQACETHLATKERELTYRRFQVIRDGLALRGRAMVEAGRAWTQLGNETIGIIEQELGAGAKQESMDKPLPPRADSATSGSSLHSYPRIPGSFENGSSEGSNTHLPQRRNSIHIPAAHAIGSEIGMPIPFMDTTPSFENEGLRQSVSIREEPRNSRPSSTIQRPGTQRASWVSQQASDEDWQDASDGEHRFPDGQLPPPIASGGASQLLGASAPTRPTTLLQRLSSSPSTRPSGLSDSTGTTSSPAVPMNIPSAPGSIFHSEEYRTFREANFSPTHRINGASTHTGDSSASSGIRATQPAGDQASNSSSEGEARVVTGRHVRVASVAAGESPDGSLQTEEYRYVVAPPRALEVIRSTAGETRTRDVGDIPSAIGGEPSVAASTRNEVSTPKDITSGTSTGGMVTPTLIQAPQASSIAVLIGPSGQVQELHVHQGEHSPEQGVKHRPSFDFESPPAKIYEGAILMSGGHGRGHSHKHDRDSVASSPTVLIPEDLREMVQSPDSTTGDEPDSVSDQPSTSQSRTEAPSSSTFSETSTTPTFIPAATTQMETPSTPPQPAYPARSQAMPQGQTDGETRDASPNIERTLSKNQRKKLKKTKAEGAAREKERAGSEQREHERLAAHTRWEKGEASDLGDSEEERLVQEGALKVVENPRFAGASREVETAGTEEGVASRFSHPPVGDGHAMAGLGPDTSAIPEEEAPGRGPRVVPPSDEAKPADTKEPQPRTQTPAGSAIAVQGQPKTQASPVPAGTPRVHPPVSPPVASEVAQTPASPPSFPTTLKEERRTSVLGRLFGRGRTAGSDKVSERCPEQGTPQGAIGKTRPVEVPPVAHAVSPPVAHLAPPSQQTPAPLATRPHELQAPETDAIAEGEGVVDGDGSAVSEPTPQGQARRPVATTKATTETIQTTSSARLITRPSNASPIPVVQEVNGAQPVPAPQRAPVAQSPQQATIVTPMQPAANQQGPTIAPVRSPEPQLHQVAPEATVQRPYKLNRKERRERERQDKEREKEEKERQKALEREEREREKALEREMKERERREKAERKQREKYTTTPKKGLLGGLIGFFGADLVEGESSRTPYESRIPIVEDQGHPHVRAEVVESDGVTATWAPPVVETTSPSNSAASRAKQGRRNSRGLAGLFGNHTRSSSTHDLGYHPPPTQPVVTDTSDERPRYVVVENKIDFGSILPRVSPSSQVPSAKITRSKSDSTRRRVAGDSGGQPAGTANSMPTNSSNFNIPRAPAPLDVEKLQAEAERDRRMSAHKRSASSGGLLEGRGAIRASEPMGWKTRTEKNLKNIGQDSWEPEQRYFSVNGGGKELLVPSYEPVVMKDTVPGKGIEGVRQRIPPPKPISSVILPPSSSMPVTGLERSRSQASAGAGKRLKKVPQQFPASQSYNEPQHDSRARGGIPPVPPLPTSSRNGDGYGSDHSGTVTRRGSGGLPGRRTSSMSIPSQGIRNEFGATVLTTGGGGGPRDSIATSGRLQGNPRVISSAGAGTTRATAQTTLGQGMAPSVARRTSLTQGVTDRRTPPPRTSIDPHHVPYPIPSVPGASAGIASIPIPRAPPPINDDPGRNLGHIIEDVARRNRQAEEQLRVLKGKGGMDAEVPVAPVRAPRGVLEGPGGHIRQPTTTASSLRKSGTVTSTTTTGSTRPQHSPLKSAMKHPSRSPSPLTNIGLPATSIPRATSPLRRADGSETYYQTVERMAGDEVGDDRQPPPPIASNGTGNALNSNSSTDGPHRRKSVRVSLQPTFSSTPPAIEYEERGWKSMAQGSTPSLSTLPSSTSIPLQPTRKRVRRAEDIWQNSSDEDEAYTKAKFALSHATSQEEQAFSAL